MSYLTLRNPTHLGTKSFLCVFLKIENKPFIFVRKSFLTESNLSHPFLFTSLLYFFITNIFNFRFTICTITIFYIDFSHNFYFWSGEIIWMWLDVIEIVLNDFQLNHKSFNVHRSKILTLTSGISLILLLSFVFEYKKIR